MINQSNTSHAMAIAELENLETKLSFPDADEIISHVNYAYITKDYGEYNASSDDFSRNCLTKCCFPRRDEQWSNCLCMCCPRCARAVDNNKECNKCCKTCHDKLLGRSPRDYESYTEDGSRISRLRHSQVMNIRLSRLSNSTWSEVRNRVDFMGTNRFTPIMTTLGGMSIIQTLGVVVAFSDIDSNFNEVLLVDTVWLYAASIFFYVVLLIIAGCMSLADPLIRNYQPEQLQIRDLVHYFESTNFSFALQWFLVLIYLCVSLAYFVLFYAVIRCTIAISQEQRGTNFLFSNRYRCYD